MRVFGLGRTLLIVCLFLFAGASTRAERLLPAAPPASRDLVVVDWDAKGQSGRMDDLSVRSLQGLVNRKNAQIWVGLDSRTAGPGWWLTKYQEMGLVTAHPKKLSKDEFLEQYKNYAKGIVVPPANLGRAGYRVAVMKAAADDLIVGSRDLAAKLGLKVAEDYSSRFTTYAQSWRYALDEFWPRLSHRAIFVDREDLVLGAVDYVVQQKLFLCAPHTGNAEEMKLFHEVLSRLPANSPVIGSAGGGPMCNEGDIVRPVSKYGKVFVGCAAVQNLSVHSGFKPAGKLSQSMRECPKLDRTKVYVAIEISDGDNSNVYLSHMPRRGVWENRGRIPLGWTIGQGTFELAPAVAGYYFGTRTPLDEFIAGVSGYAYMFPGDFGNALSSAEKEDAWRGYLKRTDEFLADHGVRTIATLHYQEAPGVAGDDVFARYADGLKHAVGLINGYNAVYKDYGGRTYQIIDGMPVFHTVTDRTWSKPGDETLEEAVIKNTPAERPVFLALFMLPFALRQEHFDQVAENLKRLEKKGYVLVLPSEVSELLKQSQAKP